MSSFSSTLFPEHLLCTQLCTTVQRMYAHARLGVLESWNLAIGIAEGSGLQLSVRKAELDPGSRWVTLIKYVQFSRPFCGL